MELKVHLEQKQTHAEYSRCLIDKVIEVPQKGFDKLMNNPTGGHNFILANAEVMHEDAKGIHCLLVLGDEGDDGIVIGASGHALYSGYLPGAKTLVQKEVEQAAAAIIREGLENTSEGNWVVFFEELEDRLGLAITKDNGFGQMIEDALNAREEVAEVELTDEGFDATYYLDYCHNLSGGLVDQPQPDTLTLSDLARAELKAFHLLPADPELAFTPATIPALGPSTLTSKGLDDWASILQAPVSRVYFGEAINGRTGMMVELDSDEAQMMMNFGNLLAGNCMPEQQEKWLTEPDFWVNGYGWYGPGEGGFAQDYDTSSMEPTM